MKKAGVLWPLASLNGNHGIGDFGKASYDLNWKCLLFMIESTLPHLLRAVL